MDIRKNIWLAVILCWLGGHVEAQIASDQKIALKENWLFLRSDLGSIWEAIRPASPGSSECVPLWEEVTLPHCFNATDAVDPGQNYYQGPGWYKTLLAIDNPYPNGRILLDFEGAGQKTRVFVYQTEVGSHVGGYDEWSVDITDAVNAFKRTPECKERFAGKIPLMVRCDNTRDTEMIPSDLSDFNVYGGLYRNLNLVYVPAVSIGNVQIDVSLSKNRKRASARVQTGLYHPEVSEEANLQVTLYDPKGNRLATKQQLVTDTEVMHPLDFELEKPVLWHVNAPALYICEVSVEYKGQKTVFTEYFGVRDFEFRENGPFFLNGERLLLRGTHRHEDHAGVAAAMTEDLMRREMSMMKEMGVNFIRLGHYQQSETILDLCDELGILVWEEIPWCRGGIGGDNYRGQARQMLTNMITQHRNHPSVIIWGLGNENDWPNDFEAFDKEEIRCFMKELHDLAHKLDDTRKTAIRRCEFCSDIVDVYSPSIWAGWYRGVFTDYKNVSHHEMQKVKRFLHVEWGGDSHARRHAEDPFVNLDKIESGAFADERAGDASLYGGTARASKDGEWSESYIVRLIDWHLKEQETMPWLTGTAYWPFKDFSTPVRPENPVPYVNQKGVVERDLTPKESYYVFQSYWAEKPMIHIYGHTWPIRWGKAGEQKEILVYSNCKEVELFVNGVSCGIKKRNSQIYPAAGLHWSVPLQEGENVVRAISKDKNGITDEIRFNYETRSWGEAAAFTAKINQPEADLCEIEVQLVDEKGVPCLTSREYIQFDLVGDGELIRNQGTSIGSSKVQAYNGRAIIRVRKTGKCILSARSMGVKTVFVEL